MPANCVTLGSGYRLRSATPVEYNRSVGILPSTPPAWKQPAVLAAVQGDVEFGSLIKLNNAPVLSRVCEKSPARSAAVGTRIRTGLPPLIAAVTGRYSCE